MRTAAFPRHWAQLTLIDRARPVEVRIESDEDEIEADITLAMQECASFSLATGEFVSGRAQTMLSKGSPLTHCLRSCLHR